MLIHTYKDPYRSDPRSSCWHAEYSVMSIRFHSHRSRIIIQKQALPLSYVWRSGLFSDTPSVESYYFSDDGYRYFFCWIP